jgi:hypothetical protein
MHVSAASLEQAFSLRSIPPFTIQDASFLNDKTIQVWLVAKAVPSRCFRPITAIQRRSKVIAGIDPKSCVASFYMLGHY